MDIPALSSAVDVIGRQADRLGSTREPDAGKAIEQFEAVFASMILKQMRQSMAGESFIPSDSGDVFGSMFDMYLGEHLSEAGGLGLSGSLHRALDS